MRRRLDGVARTWALASVIGWMVLVSLVVGSVSNVVAAPAADQDVPRLEQRRDVPQTSVDDVSADVMCPSCDTTLDQSNSPAAERMRAWVTAAVAAGWTEDEIRDGLVAEYGGDESILAQPRAQGLGIAAYLVPALLILGALVSGVLMTRRWRRTSTAQTTCGEASSSSSYSHASPSASSSDSAR